MDKYTFLIVFTSIICLALITLGIVAGLSWVYSPTVWAIEIGLDNESMVLMDESLDLASSISENISSSSSYVNKFDNVFDDNDLNKIKRYLDEV